MIKLKQRLLLLMYAAWRRRYLIVMPMLILPILGGVISKTTAPHYVAHTSFLIQETAKMNPFLEDLAVSTMLKDRLSAIKTLLKSRHVLTSVAVELNLITPDMNEQQKEWVIQKMAASLSVSQVGKDLLKIQLTSDSPQGMKALLESVSRHFIEQLLAPERSSIQDSQEFLSIHIQRRAEDLALAEQALAEFTNLNASITPEMQSQSLARLASLKQSLAEKQAELAGVEKSLGSLDQQLSKTNPVVGRIEEQIITTRSELTLLTARYTDQHSEVQAKRRALNRLEQERAAILSQAQPSIDSGTLWDLASGQEEVNRAAPLLVTQLQSLQLVRARYESLKEETKSLQAMIDELEVQVTRFGDAAKDLYRLQRDVNVKRQLYDELMQRYEMAQLTGELGAFEHSKRIKVIDLPYTPSLPANFPTVIYLIAGLVAGLGLGIGMAILTELFVSTIRYRSEMEALTGVPVLTSIPKIT
ncbi:GNVR domain-containing protein [Vibrio sp. SCSIO 43136]|uniref:GumC family protein n=1 Tax=Vibrio sp. SCSIO 43136 TaxID=2819101 RepID=UPI0020757D86|nr:GNVR domain-containing protein [Vibrio sp. SCSIO 43136]USD67790.1 chain-length determining protein [Vibrio sp. SCSIO 43136]